MKLRRAAFVSGWIFLLVVGFVGCSGEQADSETSTSGFVVKGGPDEAVMRVAKGLADGRPEVAWQSLPPSYRDDVTSLVNLAATKMDEDLWNRSFALVQKLTRLAREKRTFILEQPMLTESAGDKKELEAGWDAVASVLDTLANSELADLSKLENLDVGEFLAGTGGKLMQQMASASALAPDDNWKGEMSRMRRTQAKVISKDGKSAVVQVDRPGKPPMEETYVQVEGHWVPKKLADGWSAEISEVRQKIEKMSTESMAENKQAVLMQLSMVDAALDQLLQTETREQFNAALAPIMGMAMGAMMAQAQAAGAGSIQMTPGNAPMPGHSNGGAVVLSERVNLPGSTVAQATPTTRTERSLSGSEDGSNEMYAPGEVRFDRAHLYIGQYLRVNTNQGLNAICRLKEAQSDLLVFERALHGGSATFQIYEDELKSLRVADH